MRPLTPPVLDCWPSAPPLVSCALTCALITPALAGDDRAGRRTPGSGGTPAAGGAASADDGPTSDSQTSDGVAGAPAAPLPPGLRSWRQRVAAQSTSSAGGTAARIDERSFRISPGVTYQRWDTVDTRGPNRFHLMTINPEKAGLAIDYAGPDRVAQTESVRRQIAQDDAVAGVNGDFFDIRDTGAPLGIGKDRQRGLLHGPASGWNSAFYLDRKGRPGIGTLTMKARWKQHPKLAVTNLNSPSVLPGGIGLYTSAWGPTSGYRVTDHQSTGVRMVVVEDGRVVANKPSLSKNKPITGAVLIGRDAGADALAKIRVGTKADLSYWLSGSPRVALTGNKFLLLDGISQVVDDIDQHPRTAIGIDRDTGRILVLVLDGRQDFARGYTMVELAALMASLGADDALNLDGGGSSTMLGRKPNGRVGVLNSPSDGVEGQVANGLEITYTKPRSR